MTRITQGTRRWAWRIGVTAAAATAVVLTLFAVAWLAQPADTSPIFGIPLQGSALAYGRVKGTEDLLGAAAIAVALLRRDLRGLSYALAIVMLIPVGDATALILAGVLDIRHLFVHGVFIAVTTAAVILIRNAATSQVKDRSHD